MPPVIHARPAAGDHAPYYAEYISRVPTGDMVALLREQIDTLAALLRPLPAERAGYTYAPGKWTLREVIGHLTDTERVFSYRAVAFSRGDTSPLPSFDQDAWLPFGAYDARPLGDVLDEWIATRRATLAMAVALPEAALSRRGTASGVEFTVLAALTVLPGHVIRHLDVIEAHYLPESG